MSLIILKDKDWLQRQRIASKTVAECLLSFKKLINNKPPKISLKDIEHLCVEIIKKHNCSPSFKNYRGFPGAVCTSVNNEVVHGIPSNYTLKEGDIITLDVGATYNGAIGDAAITEVYGNTLLPSHNKIINVCKQALYKGIESIKIGKRIGVIGHAIHNFVKKHNLQVITEFGGHGLDENILHSNPFVANKAKIDEGIRIQPGLSITLEPMVTEPGYKTKIGKNGWVVTTKKINAHFEHSIFVHEDHVEILTAYE